MESQAVMRKVVMCRMPLLLVTSTLYHACRTARMLQAVRCSQSAALLYQCGWKFAVADA